MVVKLLQANNNAVMKKRKAKNKAAGTRNDNTSEVEEQTTGKAGNNQESVPKTASSESNKVSTLKKLKLGKKLTSECNLPKDQVSLAVTTTFKAHSAWLAKNKGDSLFSEDEELINLQLSLIKIPTGTAHPISCPLPHPHLSQESDVLLIVKDLEKGWEKSHEPTAEFYTELLAKKGVVGSYEILPLRQLRVENKPYEARNKLSKRFDAVFVDKRVAKFVPRYLGKAFYSSGKLPISLDLEKEDLQKEFTRALSTGVMSMMNEGASTSIVVGRTDQPEAEIVENIVAVCEKLQKKLPGNFPNIRTLSIHVGNHSWSVPLYASFATRDIISLPIVEKNSEPIVDELTTLEQGWKVAVYPGGEVKKIKDKSAGKIPKETNDAADNLEETRMETAESPRPKRALRDADEDSSDDDADLLEEQYLEEIEKTEDNNETNVRNAKVSPPKRKK